MAEEAPEFYDGIDGRANWETMTDAEKAGASLLYLFTCWCVVMHNPNLLMHALPALPRAGTTFGICYVILLSPTRVR